MANEKLIEILHNITTLLEIKGEIVFKSQAYKNAADSIIENAIDIEKAVQEGILGTYKNIGKALDAKITEYVQTGKISYYEKLKEELPESLVEITRISSMGPRKTKQVFDTLGIKSMADLEEACLENKLSALKGFTEKTQEAILNSIEHKRAAKGKINQQHAIETADKLQILLSSIPQVIESSITGDFRRFTEVLKCLHFIISTESPEKVTNALLDSKLLEHDHRDFILHNLEDINVKIDFANPGSYILELHESTGNTNYINAFNEYLNSNDFKIENCRLTQNGKEIRIKVEKDLYDVLNLSFVPPELRESAIALEKAKKGEIPKLIELSDMRGMLHVHSNWSDGKNTIRDMALRSKELGYSYMAMCDHSKSAGYANGLSIERVQQQHEEIDKLNAEGLGIYILKGIESDILSDGSLDFPEDVLATFDIVVASVHSSFKMSREDMTRRLIYALMSPYTTILGHPTGRLLLVREPYPVDIKQVIDAAVDYGKIIEINSNPYRLDLSWENVMYAKEKGLRIAINPDSHKVDTLTDVQYGIKVARKGWLQAGDVINCLGLDDFIKQVVNH